MTLTHCDILAQPAPYTGTITAEGADTHTNEQRTAELQAWLSEEAEPYRFQHQETANDYNRAIGDLAQLAILGRIDNSSTQIGSRNISSQTYSAMRVSGTQDTIARLRVTAIPTTEYNHAISEDSMWERRILSPEPTTLPQKLGYAKPALIMSVSYAEKQLQPVEDRKQAQFTHTSNEFGSVHYVADHDTEQEQVVQRLPRFEEIVAAADKEYRESTLQSVFNEHFIDSYRQAEELDKIVKDTRSAEDQAARQHGYDLIAAELRESGVHVPDAYMDEVAANVAKTFRFSAPTNEKLDSDIAGLVTHTNVRQIARIVAAYDVGEDQTFIKHRLDWFARHAPAFNEAYLNEMEANATTHTQLVEAKVAEAQAIASTTQTLAHMVMSQTVPLDKNNGWRSHNN